MAMPAARSISLRRRRRVQRPAPVG